MKIAKPFFILHYFVIILFLFYCATVNAYIINGKVVDEKIGNPIAFANVFLANTTCDTSTNKNGEFTLNVPTPGLYQLVVSHLSYLDYSSDITLSSDQVGLIVKLTVEIKDLEAVTIKSVDPFRTMNLAKFTVCLLGETKNSAKTTIENPKCLHFYRKASYKLETSKDTSFVKQGLIWSYMKAFADSFLIIRNEALGYILRYKIAFFYEDNSHIVFYGYPLFEDLSLGIKNKKRLNVRRVQAYYRSTMHFFRSLFSDSLAQNGFKVFRNRQYQDVDDE